MLFICVASHGELFNCLSLRGCTSTAMMENWVSVTRSCVCDEIRQQLE
jgi:hypothetical protein